MKNIRKEVSIWLQICIIIGIWILVLYFSLPNLEINFEAIKKLPDVISIYVILVIIFDLWAWKLPIFQKWLVPFPNLQGTWEGKINSTWINPKTNKPLKPILALLVIKQSFSSVSCTLHTEESCSYSNTAQISKNDQTGVLELSFNYSNKPKASVRHRSEIHDGAAILKIINGKPLRAEGEYWTSRKTTGDIFLKFKSKKI